MSESPLHGSGTHMNLEGVRDWALAVLGAQFPQVEVNSYGSVLLSLPDTRVVCRFRQMVEGEVTICVNAPVLLNVPATTDLYELVCVSLISFPFGAFEMGAGDSDDVVTLGFGAKLFADGLPPHHLVRAVHAVRHEAVNQSNRLKPLLGGVGILDY